MAASHLIVSRSGASTVAELAAIGRPAILVPLPHALDHDQFAMPVCSKAPAARFGWRRTLSPRNGSSPRSPRLQQRRNGSQRWRRRPNRWARLDAATGSCRPGAAGGGKSVRSINFALFIRLGRTIPGSHMKLPPTSARCISFGIGGIGMKRQIAEVLVKSRLCRAGLPTGRECQRQAAAR